jgi:hypothetical protein
MSKSTPPFAAEPPGLLRLTSEERALLLRAREQRDSETVPAALRERLLARAVEETQRAPQSHVVQVGQLVPVQSRRLAFALGGIGAAAAALVLVANARGPARGAEAAELASERSAGRAAAAREVGARLFQSELFHAPAPSLAGALPPPDASLFSEKPFSAQSRAWQVRLWNDLGASPVDPAVHELDGGALCVNLGAGDRIIGGWPWAADPAVAELAAAVPRALPAPVLPAPSPAAMPAPVALVAGRSYRLVFKAWAQEPLPEQVLIAVGHAKVPFSAAAGARVEVSDEPESFVVNFRAAHDDPSIGLAFLANAAEATRLCVSDVTLTAGHPL